MEFGTVTVEDLKMKRESRGLLPGGGDATGLIRQRTGSNAVQASVWRTHLGGLKVKTATADLDRRPTSFHTNCQHQTTIALKLGRHGLQHAETP